MSKYASWFCPISSKKISKFIDVVGSVAKMSMGVDRHHLRNCWNGSRCCASGQTGDYFSQIVEGTGISYSVVYNIIAIGLDMKKMSIRWIPQNINRYDKQQKTFLKKLLPWTIQIYYYDAETKNTRPISENDGKY